MDSEGSGPRLVPELARKEAFEHYYAQGMTGEKRSYQITALAVKLPTKTIKEWAKQDRWADKIAVRDRKVDDRLDEIAVEKVVQLKARISKNLVKAIDAWFMEHYGTDDAVKLSSQLTDIDQILKTVKLLMLLLGQPDTIKQIEGTVTHTVDDSIRGLSVDELKQLAGRKSLLSAPIDIKAEVIESKGEEEPQ